MKNVNDILSEKYFQLLNAACSPVPVFRDGYVPNDLAEDEYVMVSAINSNDDSTMNSADTETSIQVGIYTRSFTDNNSTVLNDLADKIYATIMPSQLPVFTITGFQLLSTEFAGDNTPAPFDTGSQLFINRFITFKHKIVHN